MNTAIAKPLQKEESEEEKRRKHEAKVAGHLSLVNRLELFADDVIRSLHRCTDQQLEDYLVAANTVEKTGFRIRGAIASVIRSRIAKRLTGGRSVKDVEEVGIKQQMGKVATKVGVSLRTIEEDAGIYDEFFKGSSQRTHTANILPREYYRIARTAPDPKAAIRIAENQVDDPGFTTEAFRAYVGTLTDSGKKQDVVTARKHYVKGFISQEARRAMVALCKKWKCIPEVAIERSLIEAAKEK